MNDPFAPLNGRGLSSGDAYAPAAIDEWCWVAPVPTDAPKPPALRLKTDERATAHQYLDPSGALLFYNSRIESEDGKRFCPQTLWRRASEETPEWRLKAPPEPRPLYGLDRLCVRPNPNVVICEGEKAADAAQRLLPSHACVTSFGGSKAPAKADWSPLRGLHVVIWPDADEPGQAFAKNVAMRAREAGAASIAFITPPEAVEEGWDAADALAEGWTHERTAQLVADAKLSGADGTTSKQARERRPRQRDQLMAICEKIALSHGPDNEGFAAVPVKGHCETYPIRSAAFKRWLSLEYFKATGLALGGQTLEDALRILEARACIEGPERKPWLRYGERGGSIHVDIGDPSWRVIRIWPAGHEILEHHDCPFIRSRRTRALREPEAGFSIAELRRFLNVASEDDFILVVAWLVAAMRPQGPYPILVINGEQGTGKTFLARLLRGLLDPSDPETQSPPRDERDLVVAAQNSYALFFENLSHIDVNLSDALCRISTGGGFATRQLHTDRDENLFSGARPICINAIPELADRPDLADRTIVVRLIPISEDQRRPEDELSGEWESARPRILGALYDAVSSALRGLRSPEVTQRKYGRLADFEKWVCAAEPGLGWEAGTFSAAYEANRRDASAAIFETDVVAVAVADFIHDDHPEGWSGTATELLALLTGRVAESLKRSKVWPVTARALGNHIKRVAPILRQNGILITKGKSGGERYIVIRPKSQADTPQTSQGGEH